MTLVARVICSGQSGAERGALDAARDSGTPIGGSCVRGGWAEDLTTPPGVRALYPELVETPHVECIIVQRINAAAADVQVVMEVPAPGWAVCEAGDQYELVAPDRDLLAALAQFGDGLVLHITGPMESERVGTYRAVLLRVREMLRPRPSPAGR